MAPNNKSYADFESLLGNTGEITDFTFTNLKPRVLQVKGNLRSQLAKGLIVQEADPQESKWRTHDTVDERNLSNRWGW